MGIVSDEKLAERLNSSSNIVNILKLHNGGRRPGDVNRSEEMRALAGFLAHLEPARVVAENLGMDPTMVHHYKHGNNGNGYPSPDLKDKIQEKLDAGKDLALSRMLDALSSITPAKVKELKPVAASTVAKNMASIVEKTSDRTPNTVAQFNIYAPGIKDESKYEVIEVER